MAAVSKSGTPSLASKLPAYENQIAGIADGDIEAGDCLYVSGVDTRYGQPKLKAAGKANKVDWWALHAAKSGEPIQGARNVRLHYGSGLTPGADYYVSGSTPGALVDAPASSGNPVVASAVTDTIIEVFKAPAGT